MTGSDDDVHTIASADDLIAFLGGSSLTAAEDYFEDAVDEPPVFAESENSTSDYLHVMLNTADPLETYVVQLQYPFATAALLEEVRLAEEHFRWHELAHYIGSTALRNDEHGDPDDLAELLGCDTVDLHATLGGLWARTQGPAQSYHGHLIYGWYVQEFSMVAVGVGGQALYVEPAQLMVAAEPSGEAVVTNEWPLEAVPLPWVSGKGGNGEVLRQLAEAIGAAKTPPPVRQLPTRRAWREGRTQADS